jgi:NTP pyrophosphatase (non-canonical NTP hydrolase)
MWLIIPNKTASYGWASARRCSCPKLREVAQMTLNEYQTWQQTMAFYPQTREFEGLVYTILAMGGEAGEVQNELKKIIRDRQAKLTPESKDKLILELGDVLWYISAAASELGVGLETIAAMNQSKLEQRKSEHKPVG